MEPVRFEELGIDDRILRAVTEMGFEEATPIQAKAIPEVMTGQDIIGQAQTGTGKTASFGIPMLQKVDPKNRHVQAIVLCPTRELAIQSADEIRKLAKFMHGIKVLPIYGGQDIVKQIRSLKTGVQVLIGTPGRVMDHMRRHTIKLDDLKILVLDEGRLVGKGTHAQLMVSCPEYQEIARSQLSQKELALDTLNTEKEGE